MRVSPRRKWTGIVTYMMMTWRNDFFYRIVKGLNPLYLSDLINMTVLNNINKQSS